MPLLPLKELHIRATGYLDRDVVSGPTSPASYSAELRPLAATKCMIPERATSSGCRFFTMHPGRDGMHEICDEISDDRLHPVGFEIEPDALGVFLDQSINMGGALKVHSHDIPHFSFCRHDTGSHENSHSRNRDFVRRRHALRLRRTFGRRQC